MILYNFWTFWLLFYNNFTNNYGHFNANPTFLPWWTVSAIRSIKQ